MKISGLQSTYSKISRTKLNQLVDLSGAFGDAHKELLGAQSGLASYAIAKNIRMSFNNMLLRNFMDVTITHENGKQAKSVINSNVNEIETVERQRMVMLENKDEVNYAAIGTESHEDNFLRRVYRTVETLTNLLQKQ